MQKAVAILLVISWDKMELLHLGAESQTELEWIGGSIFSAITSFLYASRHALGLQLRQHQASEDRLSIQLSEQEATLHLQCRTFLSSVRCSQSLLRNMRIMLSSILKAHSEGLACHRALKPETPLEPLRSHSQQNIYPESRTIQWAEGYSAGSSSPTGSSSFVVRCFRFDAEPGFFRICPASGICRDLPGFPECPGHPAREKSTWRAQLIPVLAHLRTRFPS